MEHTHCVRPGARRCVSMQNRKSYTVMTGRINVVICMATSVFLFSVQVNSTSGYSRANRKHLSQ